MTLWLFYVSIWFGIGNMIFYILFPSIDKQLILLLKHTVKNINFLFNIPVNSLIVTKIRKKKFLDHTARVSRQYWRAINSPNIYKILALHNIFLYTQNMNAYQKYCITCINDTYNNWKYFIPCVDIKTTNLWMKIQRRMRKKCICITVLRTLTVLYRNFSLIHTHTQTFSSSEFMELY